MLYYLFMLCIRNRIAKISIIMLSFSASLMNYTSQTGYSAKPNSIWAILQFATPASKLHFLIGMGSWMTLFLSTEKIYCEKPELTLKGCHAVSLLMCCCPNCQGKERKRAFVISLEALKSRMGIVSEMVT